MKQNESRHEAEKSFIEDRYFEKGHLWHKLYVTLGVIIGWIAVLIPIYWTVSSTLFRNEIQPVWNYKTGISIYFTMDRWLLVTFAAIIVFTVFLTVRNNINTKKHLHQKILYDQEKLHQREHIYDDLMTKRFGDQALREKVRYYEIPGTKNLTTSELREAYEEGDAKL